MKSKTWIFLLMIAALITAPVYSQTTGSGRRSSANYTLRVVSNAPNSVVFINAVAQAGTTPLDISLAAGAYDIVVRASGYRDYTTKINLSRDLTINARLTPMNYQLTINANPRGASIFIDDTARGKAPTTLTLQAGRYALRLSESGYEDYEAAVNLNRNLTINASLRAVIYTVGISSNVKGATVYVDGASRGSAPANLQLQAGTYTVRVAADGYIDATQSIQVTGNTSTNFALQPALADVRLVIPESFHNPFLKNPLSLIQVFVDEEPVPQPELLDMRFQVRPGRREIALVSGGLYFEETFTFSAGTEYQLRFASELLLSNVNQGR